MISDKDLRDMENAMCKALFYMLLQSDLKISGANFKNDDIPTLTLDFGSAKVLVTLKAEKVGDNEQAKEA